MKSDRGWYLVALGMIALGITNSSVGDSARGFLDHTAVVADQASARAIQAVAVALAKAQVRIALAQARINARRAMLDEGRSHCALADRANRAVVLSSQEDSDQDGDFR